MPCSRIHALRTCSRRLALLSASECMKPNLTPCPHPMPTPHDARSKCTATAHHLPPKPHSSPNRARHPHPLHHSPHTKQPQHAPPPRLADRYYSGSMYHLTYDYHHSFLALLVLSGTWFPSPAYTCPSIIPHTTRAWQYPAPTCPHPRHLPSPHLPRYGPLELPPSSGLKCAGPRGNTVPTDADGARTSYSGPGVSKAVLTVASAASCWGDIWERVAASRVA